MEVNNPKGTRWSDAEMQILRGHPRAPASDLARLLPKRSVKAIMNKRADTGTNANHWSGAELVILHKNRTLPSFDLMPLLPGRSEKSISNRRERSGLHFKAWSTSDIVKMMELAPRHTVSEAARILGISTHRIKIKAKELSVEFRARPAPKLRLTVDPLVEAIRHQAYGHPHGTTQHHQRTPDSK
jgi:hypothetical protein